MKYLSRCLVARFEDLAQICSKDPFFPKSEAEWNALILLADQTLDAEGGVRPPDLALDPEVFERWCQTVAVIPCLDALKAYVLVQRARISPAAFFSNNVRADEP